jgi:hypothetical protein
MNGVDWCENGAEPEKFRRCDAHEMRHGALKWRARRDRRAERSKTLLSGVLLRSAKK